MPTVIATTPSKIDIEPKIVNAKPKPSRIRIVPTTSRTIRTGASYGLPRPHPGVLGTCNTPHVLVQIHGITTPEDAEMVNALFPDNVGVVLDEGFQTWDCVNEANVRLIVSN